jgi:hypothetical protein
MGKSNAKETLQELFQNKNKMPTVQLPCNITNICKAVNNNMYDEDYIINRHTNLPFYYPFLNENNQNYIRKIMKNNNAQGIYAKVGIIAGGVCNKRKLHYCPNCVKDDIRRVGEAYFHRIHQIPGVLVCPIHLCELNKYELRNTERGRISLVKINSKQIDLAARYIADNEINTVLIKIAKNAQYLLDNNLVNINQHILVKRYKEILRNKGLITPKNRVRQKLLNSMFKKYYNNRLLEMLDSKVDNKESNWLKSTLRCPRNYINPIRHILFILFISEDIQSFIGYGRVNNNNKVSWLCLNKVCKYYKKNIIKDYRLTVDYKAKKPIGTFKCEYCGFEYSRNINQNDRENIYKIGRIKSFGHLWQDKLIDLIECKQYNVNKISKIMGCDPKTIVKYARKLGKGDYINSKIRFKKYKKTKSIKNYKNIYSKDILLFISNNINCTRTEVRKTLEKQYMWFYRNDKGWLNDNLPKVRKQLERKSNINIRVDWNKRDKEIYIQIKNTYIEMIRNSQNMRITKSILGNKLGISALLDYYLEKLPKTKKYIGEISETVEEFQIRRVKKICRTMIHQNCEIKLWKVMRIAGLKKTCSINVINMINYYKSKNKII